MKKIPLQYVLFLSAFLWSLWVGAQTILAERRVDWQDALSTFSFSEPGLQLNVLDFGAVADGKTDNTAVVESMMAVAKGRAAIIFFPKGKYFFASSLVLADSIVLKGEGPERSELIFDLNTPGEHAVKISGSAENRFVNLKGGYLKGSRKVLCDSASYFRAGDWFEMRQTNGSWNTVPAEWAKWSVGQVGRIVSVSGDTLIFEHPLRIDFTDSLHPQIQRIFPIQNTGLACLKIKRLNSRGTGSGYNVYFDYAANGLVSGIESDSSVASHVYISRSTQIRIERSYFHHAFMYDGTNTQGYGVTLAHHSGGCLITDNIFEHLRHAMMLKTGANGNVISYNYSTDPFRSEAISDGSGDLSLHGHFPFSNLMEGNVVQNIIIDHYWGPSGPWNTFFRNRAALYGIIMTDSDTTETGYQNFVGNETTDSRFFHGLFALTGAHHFSYGNHILQAIIPAGTDSLSDSSYYLNQAPSFWPIDSLWPSIGLPRQLGKGSIPAQWRFLSGSNFTGCSDSVHVSVTNRWEKSPEILLFPNPATTQFEIRLSGISKGFISYVLYDAQAKVWMSGSQIYTGHTVVVKPGHAIPKGIYVLDVRVGAGHFKKKLAIY